MSPSGNSRQVVRFCAFEFNPATKELRKHGVRIKLHGQPVDVLAMLVGRHGETVSREELQQRLWPADTNVDFEHSLNAAVKRLRAALGDSPESPRFIETFARQGYRFIAEIEDNGPLERNAGSCPAASIAVLPFVNLGGDQASDYFGSGLAEDVINELTTISGLKVTARTSAFAFKGQNVDIRVIAEALAVAHVLEGSFRIAGDHVRVTAQLITAADGCHLWSERYNRDLSDVLGIQDDIAQSIASALRTQLQRTGERRPASSEAYRAYMEGRYYVQHATPPSLERALECYQRSMQLDPAYALPHSGLALRAYYQVLYLGQRPRDLVPAALTSLGRALQLDPDSAQSHVVRGVFSAFYEFNWQAAEEHFARALQMDPASPMVRAGYALWFLLPAGRLESALEEIERAVSLDPLSPAVRMGELWIMNAMKKEEAVDRARVLIQLFPALPICRFVSGRALLRCGLLDEAIDLLQEGLKIVPTDVFLLGVLALARARKKQVEHAGQIRAVLQQRAGTRYTPFLARAYCAEACGDKDLGLQLFGEAIDEREPLAVLSVADQRNADVPAGFQQRLLRKMNLS
ncbi:MAG TPA: winged helix-turn-helix domain-containing protein [Candidatus Acidoferrales bacterium]|nr:winged helix-turn-helix domain-containing protein [Candidatus Acidoferrales bacterium]